MANEEFLQKSGPSKKKIQKLNKLESYQFDREDQSKNSIRKRKNTALPIIMLIHHTIPWKCRFMMKNLLYQLFVFADATTEAKLNLYTSDWNC